VIEFHFRASDGLPAGRYYLTVNITDQYGIMSAVDAEGYDSVAGTPVPDSAILEYSIKYMDAANPTTIAQDIQNLTALLVTAPPAVQEDYVRLINALFQQVDEP